jgi:hypothetical protein
MHPGSNFRGQHRTLPLRAPRVTWTKLRRSSNYFALPLGQKSIGANLQPYGPTRKKRNGNGDKKLG